MSAYKERLVDGVFRFLLLLHGVCFRRFTYLEETNLKLINMFLDLLFEGRHIYIFSTSISNLQSSNFICNCPGGIVLFPWKLHIFMDLHVL